MSFDVPKEFGVRRLYSDIGKVPSDSGIFRSTGELRLYSDIGKVPSDSGIFRSTGELREFVLGLNGPYGKGEKGPKGRPHPSPWTSPNWTREGGAPFLLSPSPFPFPTPTRKGGVLLPVGVGLPPWRALLLGRRPPPCSFIYGGRGAPHRHTS